MSQGGINREADQCVCVFKDECTVSDRGSHAQALGVMTPISVSENCNTLQNLKDLILLKTIAIVLNHEKSKVCILWMLCQSMQSYLYAVILDDKLS